MQADAMEFLSEVQEFHDWFVSSCSYEPRFKTDTQGAPVQSSKDALLRVGFVYDSLIDPGEGFSSFEVEFENPLRFESDPENVFPLEGCTLEKVRGFLIWAEREQVKSFWNLLRLTRMLQLILS